MQLEKDNKEKKQNKQELSAIICHIHDNPELASLGRIRVSTFDARNLKRLSCHAINESKCLISQTA